MKIVSHRSPALVLGLLATVLLTLLMLAAGCSDDKSVTYPDPYEAPIRNWMYDVYGTAADDVHACGAGGALYHFDGTDWTRISLGTTRNVTMLWGTDDATPTLYACGGGGNLWRNSGSGWNSMDSGTSAYLVSLGEYYGDILIGGTNGALRRLSDGSWEGTRSTMVIRNPSGAPTDTLSRLEDVASFVTVNHYFVGGAYRLKTWEQDVSLGTDDTDGMVIGPDVDFPDDAEYGRFDWQLRPLRGDEIAYSEWVQCSTSDDEILGNNYIGTTEGWVFRLTRNEEDRLVWSKLYPRITEDPRAAVNDMWLDNSGDLYLVTHSGQLVYQSSDYAVDETTYEVTGFRVVQQVTGSSLMGIWASDPENIYVVGLMEDIVMRYRFDSGANEFVQVAIDTLGSDSAKSLQRGDYPDAGLDRFGRPIEP